MRSPLASSVIALICVVLSATSAFPAVLINFSGGNGTPLTMTLSQPVTFTITTATTAGSVFIIKDAGNLFNQAHLPVSGTARFTLNGGPEMYIDRVSSGFLRPSTTEADINFSDMNGPSILAVGDIVVLEGSWTTSNNISDPAPLSGYYTMFMTNVVGVAITGPAVPEPSTYALLALGAGAVLWQVRRRRVA